jgi:hypothetical protein
MGDRCCEITNSPTAVTLELYNAIDWEMTRPSTATLDDGMRRKIRCENQIDHPYIVPASLPGF